MNIKTQVIESFKKEFQFLIDKFEIMDILENGTPLDYKAIKMLKLPSADYNVIYHPGVYVFIGNNSVYRVGVSMRNSRVRVMEHIKVQTWGNNHSVIDIDKFSDKSILLFNVKNYSDSHWLLSLEVFLEETFKPLIKAKRKG